MSCAGPTPADCSDAILVKLQHETAFKLRADTPTDTVHGSLTIVHGPTHEFIVEIYDADESPNSVHSSMFKRPATMPTEATIHTRLDS